MTETSLTVLVADDSATMRSLISLSVRQNLSMVDVVLASDVPSLLAMYQKYNPDILCLDVQMPGGSGPDAAIEIWQNRPDIPIIFITSETELPLGGLWTKLKKHDACWTVLYKPFREYELRLALLSFSHMALRKKNS